MGCSIFRNKCSFIYCSVNVLENGSKRSLGAPADPREQRGVVINYVAKQHTNTATTITTCKYSYLWSVIDANNVTSQGRGWRKVM